MAGEAGEEARYRDIGQRPLSVRQWLRSSPFSPPAALPATAGMRDLEVGLAECIYQEATGTPGEPSYIRHRVYTRGFLNAQTGYGSTCVRCRDRSAVASSDGSSGSVVGAVRKSIAGKPASLPGPPAPDG